MVQRVVPIMITIMIIIMVYFYGAYTTALGALQ